MSLKFLASQQFSKDKTGGIKEINPTTTHTQLPYKAWKCRMLIREITHTHHFVSQNHLITGIGSIARSS